MRQRWAVVFLFLFVCLVGAEAQTTSGISGVVMDPSGAVVPRAAVRVNNAQTGAERTANADEQGRYNFSQLQPGTYAISAEAAGFTRAEVTQVHLLVNTPAVVDLRLSIGKSAETVSVAGEVTQVNTQDATLGNAIGTRPILQLPFEARNVVNLLSLQPGVTASGNVSGGKSDQGNVSLDGVDVNDQQYRSAFTSVLRNTLDSISEFRVTTTNGNADTGRTSGAQVALLTKSGTNDIHGAAYEYHRNTLTAANDFFNNMDGIERQKLIQNVFGGAIGGPIKKNRLFYFLNYEGRRDASEGTVVRTVPNALFRQGIFTYQTSDGSQQQLNPAQIKALDPTHVGGDPNVLKVLQGYPEPNDPTVGDGLNTAGYRFKSATPLSYNTYIARIDYQADAAGKHMLFWRGNLQNDSLVNNTSSALPQFPGQPDSSVHLENTKGMAIGYTWIISPTLVNNLRYGLTRQSYDDTGAQNSPIVSMRGLDTPFATTTGLSATVPVHNIEENMTFTSGAHTLTVGGSFRIIRSRRLSFAHSFSSASSDNTWFNDNARQLLAPDVDSSTQTAYLSQMVNLLGLVPLGTAVYNYDKQGNVLPQGQGIQRDFADNEYEAYFSDVAKVTRGLTITWGAHLNVMPPLYEVNGYQVSTNIPLSEWMNDRGGLAEAGLPQSMVTPLSFNLAGAAGGRPLYPLQRHVAPRLAIAYSPQSATGWRERLFGGPGKTSIRAGFGVFYDLFGQSLIRLSDQNALGFTTTLQNPTAQTYNLPRFISSTQIPGGLLTPAPPGGFPQVAPDAYADTSGIDDQLKAPYTMNMDFTIGRDIGKGFYLQGSYVGRLSRRSLIGDDVAAQTNLVDNQSGQTYFQAATAMQRLVRAGTAVGSVPAIPFFEHVFPGYAGSGLTATQNIYQNYWSVNPQSDTTALQGIDSGVSGCSPCSILGPNALYNSQFSALTAFRSVGNGNYHSFQLTARKQFSNGLQFDFNYTFSKSIDLGSTTEAAGQSAGSILNPWNPGQMRAVSDYDITHLISAFFVAELPFGRGRRFAGNTNRIVNGFIGGWQLSGIWRLSSGLPVGVDNGGFWPTNWNQEGFATQAGPFSQGTTKNSPTGGPNIFTDPQAAFNAFDFTYPGQSGSRNVVRGDRLFNLDLALAKRFIMPYNEHHSIQIRAEAFNVSNTPSFSVSALSLSLGSSFAFGRYNGVSNPPRVMQFGARYEF